jgi:hypothetical protein
MGDEAQFDRRANAGEDHELFKSLRLAGRVSGLSMFPNHSASGETSPSCENSAEFSARRQGVTGLGVRFLEGHTSIASNS